jgi:hypothetical protein
MWMCGPSCRTWMCGPSCRICAVGHRVGFFL